MNVENGTTRLTLAQFDHRRHTERHGDDLHLFLENHNRNQDGDEDLLCSYIENTSGEVALYGPVTAPAVLVPFLTAVRRNENIQCVSLYSLTFSADSLTTLVRLSNSMKHLTIQGCRVAEPAGTWEADVLRELNDNNTIRTVTVGDSDVDYLQPIIMHLAHRTEFHLIFTKTSGMGDARGPASLRMANIIRGVLMSGPPSLLLECNYLEFDEESFSPIAEGAINGGNSTTMLIIMNCSFDKAATDLFEGMFRPDSNLRSLAFSRQRSCTFCSFSKPVDVVMKTVLHPDSPLESLGVSILDDGDDSHDDDEEVELSNTRLIAPIMNELAVNEALQCLQIHVNNNVPDDIFDIVKSGIPKFHGLQELRFGDFQLNDAQRPAMMDSLKRNHTIRRFLGLRDVFPNARDHRTLRFLESRNQNIADLLEGRATIPPSLLPRFFGLVQDCEYGARIIYRLMPQPGESDGPDSWDNKNSSRSIEHKASIDEENFDFEQNGLL